MNDGIAIVGMACVYPDANSPQELWENVLSQRRAFREIPKLRLNAEDYFDPDPTATDCTYSLSAAVIEGYVFDRVRFRVFEAGFRAADHAHWLALDVASRAMEHAGFPKGNGLPRETTGVILGNTLTGEFSRANNLRLRWPFVRRVFEEVFESDKSIDPDGLLSRIEQRFKEPFPETTEDSLPGGMSNTIAGRINSHFGFQGLGYTIDGACASSLLAVTQSCSALVSGDLDVALAGGVDLSLDPFEMVGFAKAGALAQSEMHVYDRRANGFWPGEGCGFVILMRESDALALKRPIHALIHGWGTSADGQASLTRPDIGGQRLALGRAYRRAGFGMDTVSYFEGHGTGTQIGDEVELSALMHELRRSGSSLVATIGSIKANIGHAKAAAGMAGLIKAVKALSSQILPPQVACDEPCDLLRRTDSVLKVLREPAVWPCDRPLRAAVSAMGFGGVNVHIPLSTVSDHRRCSLSPSERRLAASPQDADAFFFSAPDVGELKDAINQVAGYADRLSLAELTDLAAALARRNPDGHARAAVVASTPKELKERLKSLATTCDQQVKAVQSSERGIFFARSCGQRARVGFLFSGQGVPLNVGSGAWRRRFNNIRDLIGGERQIDSLQYSTAAAQPSICAAALAGLNVLSNLGIRADIAIGHSLGELVSLHWAGVFSADTLLELATARGRIMENNGLSDGRMLAVFANPQLVEPLIAKHDVTIVCFNSPTETVVGGPRRAIENVAKAARASGLSVAELPVRHAFHTTLMRPAQRPFAEVLGREAFAIPTATIYSTVVGDILPRDADIPALLVDQLCTPVRFSETFNKATIGVDVWLEIGSGNVIGLLAKSCGGTNVYSIDVGGQSLKPLLNALAAIHTVGGDFRPSKLFEDRFTRPFQVNWQPTFFNSPCELSSAERPAASLEPDPIRALPQKLAPLTVIPKMVEADNAFAIVRALISTERGIPVTEIAAEHPMKTQYDLGSSGARLIAIKAVQPYGFDLRTFPQVAEFKFGICTVGSLADLVREILTLSNPSKVENAVNDHGLRPWVETFEISLEEMSRPEAARSCTVSNGELGYWEVLAQYEDERVRRLRAEGQLLPGRGAIVCFPRDPTERDLHGMIEVARSAVNQRYSTFIHVHHGKGASGFVRSLKMEQPGLRTAVFCVGEDDADSAKWISEEIIAFLGHPELPHVEVHRLSNGRRMEPRIRYQPLDCFESGENKPGATDVFLVTGGAKGFTAEWVSDIARETGARFALIGRSVPSADHRLAQNLRLLTERGVVFCYYSADVLNPLIVSDVVGQAVLDLGPITGVIHAAAATDDTCAILELTSEKLLKTVRTKVEGLRNLLAALPGSQLRWLYALGSIIARVGLPGEASYALANEWLAHTVEDFKCQFPNCRCVTLELSALEGEGRATRVGREFLEGLGIHFMPPSEVLHILRRTFACKSLPSRIIVSGRFGNPPTIRFREGRPSALRFAHSPRVYYPGVELIAEPDLTFSNDPYLRDHAIEGEHVFPAALALEAAAQIGDALCPGKAFHTFKDVHFKSRIVVAETAGLFPEERSRIRIIGQRSPCNQIEFGFQQGVPLEPTGEPNFFGKCTFILPDERSGGSDLRPLAEEIASGAEIPTDQWYGRLFFHKGRFRRIRAYHLLRAKQCLFELRCEPNGPWFHRTFSQDLLLGDPGARDAAIHGIQACIPHRRLLPVAVDEIQIMDPVVPRRYVEAHERTAQNDEFTYDVRIFDDRKRVVETWRHLKLLDAGELNFGNPWPLALLSVYVERRVSECFPHLQFKLEISRRLRHGENRSTNGKNGPVYGYNANGKPFGDNGHHVSRAHALGLTAVVFDSPSEIACDLEVLGDATLKHWSNMLPPSFLALAEDLASRLNEPLVIAATKVFTAWETLSEKLGATCDHVSMAHQFNNGWVLLRSCHHEVAVGQISARFLHNDVFANIHGTAKRDVIFAFAARHDH